MLAEFAALVYRTPAEALGFWLAPGVHSRCQRVGRAPRPCPGAGPPLRRSPRGRRDHHRAVACCRPARTHGHPLGEKRNRGPIRSTVGDERVQLTDIDQ
jgi:hypothetical protein